jgi:phosphohistidine phosphatase SixA
VVAKGERRGDVEPPALRLILMRHAKSAHDAPELADKDRPLNERGRQDAPRIALEIVDRGWAPDVALVSDSLRTRETLELMLPALRGLKRIEFLSSFYEGGYSELLSALATLAPEEGVALAVGHNPGWETSLERLTGRRESLTTANAALLEATGRDWGAVTQHEGGWRLCEILRPKEL